MSDAFVSLGETDSFESSVSDSCGDILNTRSALSRTTRIGFLGCGYFEYWRMFSDEFKRDVLSDLERVASRLRKDFEVIFPCVVDTLDAADFAGRAFADARIEMLVVVEGTYLPDFITLQAIDHVPDVPVVLFTTQAEENISPADNYESLMRNSALIGTAQLSGTFRKMGREYEIIVGSIGEERPYIELAALAKAQNVVKRLKQLNVGVIGHVFRGMYDLENDKTKVKGSLGPNVIYVELSHLMEQWEKIPPAEIETASTEYASRFKMRGSTAEDLAKSCRLGIAMERLANRLHLDALCFLGQHYIEKATGAPARLGASMMLEKGERLVACEGDLAGLVIMSAMQWLTGNSPLQAEWGQYDASHNAIFMVGHGVASPSLAANDESITLTGAPEEWGFQGSGVNMEFIMRPGTVTMAHLLDSREGWQMLISGGESLEYPCLPCEEIHALIRVEKPVKHYIAEVQRKGVPHHVIIVHGDIREELRLLANALDISHFTV